MKDAKLPPLLHEYEIRHLFYARDIQKALLPKERHFARTGLDFSVYHAPKDILSGDFYWLGMKNENVFAAVGDCTGHGISAALLTVLGMSMLNYICHNKNFYLPGQILSELDKKWIEAFQDDALEIYNNDWCDISFLFIDTAKKEVLFSGAHAHLIKVDTSGQIHVIKGERYPIGGWQLEKKRSFKSHLMEIKDGDIYCMITDGIIHQFGGNCNAKFGWNRLKSILNAHRHLNAKEITNAVEEALIGWQKNHDATDDRTLMLVKF
ncbi:MAG: SpoIIE family protein phosphatase [Bacteroidia bacterium]|nr:SpoIIE family protein phosphatase [Bacteroidia bacterium]